MNRPRIPASFAVSETSKIFEIGPLLVEQLYEWLVIYLLLRNYHYILCEHPFKLDSKLSNLHQKFLNTIPIQDSKCFGWKEMVSKLWFFCLSVSFLEFSWNPTNVRNTLRQHPQLRLPADMNPSRIPACCAVSETSKIFGIGPVLVEQLYV